MYIVYIYKNYTIHVELAPGAPTWSQIHVTLWGELQLVSHVWDDDQFLVTHFKLVSTGQVSFCLRPI